MSDLTHRAWLTQYTDLHARLGRYVTVIDGQKYLDPDAFAPQQLLDLYQQMQSVGYARGWL